MSSTQDRPDLCVIGASEAGLAACLGAVALGLSCVLVDDGDQSGYRNPDLTLAMLARAAADPARHAAAWTGLAQALAAAAPDRSHARFGALNVRLLRGRARFIDAATLQVGDATLRARRVFIATGGIQPSHRLAAGLPQGACLTVADVGQWRERPRAVLVVGGGLEALSIAQSLARLGSRVTLMSDALLPDVDPELAAPLLAQLRQDGVTIVPGPLQGVEASPGGVEARLPDGTSIEATHLILAEAWRPALEALDLARAGVATNAQGLVLDAGLRTSRRTILAIGRAAGAGSSPEGIMQAGHALKTAFTPVPGRLRPECVPVVSATLPEIATVGRLPAAAAARIWRWPLSQTGGALLAVDRDGSLKVVTDRHGRILWVGLVGSEVRELISFWSLAIARNLTLADLGDVLAPLPSRSEAHRAIVVQEIGRRLASPWVRRALNVMRRLG
ncbi:FAD-dependent oxidoreductase [Lichenihabitans sp. Uapishka_5]|uniref:FAD-dependent oxidoreductase n=1 Tax=Lichenihabitans sp. Uapishka_5 TaxID=3037302 RepID=UPI0029E815E7|nr:FAD-dependent oxidoreductase [Lichenihabitans sp. Uapishka_5]MDX7950674.1 FAD-dependent oxidoreductase [Lichenihabitans sp. Uapishka_5]